MALPPLRERHSDIIPLAEMLLKKHGGSQDIELSYAARRKLENHDWPGNVRELENCIQRALILCDGISIEAENIEFAMEDENFFESGPRERTGKEDSSQSSDNNGLLDGNLKAMESQTIVDALAAVNGSRKIAAEKLGISPRTLRYKIARLKDQGVSIPAAMR